MNSQKMIKEVFEMCFQKHSILTVNLRVHGRNLGLLKHIRLIVALEEAINRELTDEEITKLIHFKARS